MMDNSDHIAYRSIFLEPGWISRRFQGWKPLHEDLDGCLLSLKSWPTTRYLILSYSDIDQIEALLQRHVAWLPTTRVSLKRFNVPWEGAEKELELNGKVLKLVNDSQRVLNKYTFVFSLEESEETLWGRFNQTTRRKCNTARRFSPQFSSIQDPNDERFHSFINKLKEVSTQRSFQIPSESMLSDILRSGAGTLHVMTEAGVPVAMLILYRAGETVYYLYGITMVEANQGGGHLIHWEAMLHYKAIGCKWYDFGGISSLGDDNGIYRFKRGFGGHLVDLGAEYRWQGSVLDVALGAKRWLRSHEVTV